MDVSSELVKPAECEKHGAYQAKGFRLSKNTHWTICPECSKESQAVREAEEAQREALAKQRRMEGKLNQCGIPIRFRTKNFESFIADTDGKEKALSVAMEFAGNFQKHCDNGSTIVFSGKPGTGKSHLAIAIAQEVMKDGTAFYTSAIDAVRMVRDTWRRDSAQTESQVLSEFASVDLLVLDEVGVQYGTEAEQVTLFDIIDKRYRDLMPTILLTNLSTTGMKTFLGDRSYDRLREGGAWVTFDWESQRSKAMI